MQGSAQTRPLPVPDGCPWHRVGNLWQRWTSPLPCQAWQVASSPLLSSSVWIPAVGLVLCLHLPVKVRGWGNGHILEGQYITEIRPVGPSPVFWSLLYFRFMGLMSLPVELTFGGWETQFLEATGPSLLNSSG